MKSDRRPFADPSPKKLMVVEVTPKPRKTYAELMIERIVVDAE